MIDRAEPLVRAEQASRPCDYDPWKRGLLKLGKQEADWPKVGRYTYEIGVGGLMSFADYVSSASWPENHIYLADFVIRFLEADVMLFRSGYAKKKLLKRLKNADLTTSQIERIHGLLRRSVVNGTGLEEYRELCRLGAKVMSNDLCDWLTHQADGVFVAVDDRYGYGFFYWHEKLGDEVFNKYGTLLFGRRAEVLVAANPPHPIIRISEVPKDNIIKLNAWRMLMHLKRTEN